MARADGSTERTAPERRCIVSGASGDAARLIRFVVGPDDWIVPDILGKLPGRGIWVSADLPLLEQAATGKPFAKAARKKVQTPDDLVKTVERLLAQRSVALLAMARKAGEAVAGFEKAKSWLENGAAEVLLQASDGSERGKSKLRPPAGPDTLVSVLTGAELGHAFGRENVIHGALAGGGLTQRVVEETTRLAGLRLQDGDATSPGKENKAS